MSGRPVQNLIGKQFGHLTVMMLDTEKRTQASKYWICECDCGGKIVVRGSSLLKGCVSDCGCCSNDYIFLPYGNRHRHKPEPKSVKEAKPTRECSIKKLNDEGCALLLEAFLANLSEDYYSAYNFYMCNRNDDKARLSYVRLRRFFMTKYFAALTGLDGKAILDGLDRINNVKRMEVI